MSQYAMNMFKFPKYIYDDIDNIITKFFWNNNKMDKLHIDRQPIRSIAWDKISKPKSNGGLGIRKTKDLK